ncbi:MAG: PAS domain S-box protein [Anaerolineae bacterium]|jgi:PAS domain S-box-containing protein|nr:PAS domain S-box protein [Anaerolineae bacterium]
MIDARLQPDCAPTEALLDRSRQWIRAVACATGLLVVGGVPEPDVLAAMEALQEVTSAERVCIQVTRHTAPLDEAQTMLRNLPEHLPATPLQLSERWRRALSVGELVHGDQQCASEGERRSLADLGITTYTLVPLIVGDILRGCIRLENTNPARLWSSEEQLALRAIGTVFGNALGYREARLTLKESEARYQRLVDNEPDAIYRMSLPDGVYEYMSPAATEITGYTPEQYLSTPFLVERMLHPGWRGYFEQQRALLLQGKAPPEYAFAIIHGRTGETRWLHQRNVLIRDASGKPTAIEGIITDVTQQHLAEARLRNREATLQSILSTTPIGIGFNSDRTMLIVNDELCRMTGYTAEELVGRVTDFLYPTHAEFSRVGAELVAQLERGIIGSIETQWVRKDGRVLDVLMYANCVTPDDYAIGVTFAVIDLASIRG